MNRILRYLATLLLATINVATLHARPPMEMRQHYIVFGATEKYVATHIEFANDTLTRNTTLLNDQNSGALYRLEMTTNYATGVTEYRLTDLASKEWVATRYTMPTAGKDRASAQAEIARMAKEGKIVKVTMYTAKASEELDERAWHERSSEAERSRITGSLSPRMLAAVASLQRVASIPLLEAYCSQLLAPLTAQNCLRSPDIKFAQLPPNCGFDAKFGEQCSEKQQAKALAVVKNSGNVKYY
jgi:hypothetical protein